MISPPVLQERTLEEHRKMLNKVVKRDQKRRKRIEAAGIEYQCPELVSIPTSQFFYVPLHYINLKITTKLHDLFVVSAYRLEIPSHYLRRSSLVKTSYLVLDKLLFLYVVSGLLYF